MKKAALRKLLDRLYNERAAAEAHANALRAKDEYGELAIGLKEYKVKSALSSAQFAHSLIDNVLDLFCDEE